MQIPQDAERQIEKFIINIGFAGASQREKKWARLNNTYFHDHERDND